MFELNYMPRNPGKIGLVLESISEDELRLRRVLSNASGHYLRSLLKGANIDPNSCPVTYMAMGVAIKGIYATIPTAIREQSKAALTLKLREWRDAGITTVICFGANSFDYLSGFHAPKPGGNFK